jgi:sodium/bile acid cotransporter 7
MLQKAFKVLDPFLVILVSVVLLASILPCRGEFAHVMGYVTDFAIALLFFTHGAKLSREAVFSGIGHWRLHLLVLASTFILFPALGLATRALTGSFVNPTILAGVVFLCVLPSTVQSSIAFTAIAGGNLPAAICSATLSNILGVFITPALVGIFISTGGGSGGGPGAGDAIKSIAEQLLLPFIAGHLCRPLLVGFLNKYKKQVAMIDRTSILLVIYTAFSAAVVEGIWHKLTGRDFAAILVIDAVILALVVLATTLTGKALGFSREDQISIVFCGSKKTLASGVPMAGVLFPAPMVGAIILPLMLFHQMQLMLCAVLARRYAAEGERIAAALAQVDTDAAKAAAAE